MKTQNTQNRKLTYKTRHLITIFSKENIMKVIIMQFSELYQILRICISCKITYVYVERFQLHISSQHFVSETRLRERKRL